MKHQHPPTSPESRWKAIPAQLARRTTSGTLVLWLAVAATAVSLPTQTALGQSSGNEAKQEKSSKKQSFTVTPVVFKKLSEIQELLEAEQIDEAYAALDKLQKKKLTDHEKALVWQTYGFAYSSQSKYEKAAQAFEKCLANGALPDGTLSIIRYNLGQIYMALEEFEKALHHLNIWLAGVENPNANAYYLIGIAHAQLQQTKQALPYIEKAVAKSKNFNESWSQLLLALYFEEKQYDDAIKVLDVLIAHSPKKTYLQQLQGLYGEVGKEKKALAAMELSYRLGYLEDKEQRNLARLYLYHEVPILAAQVVESGLANGEIEGDREAWELLADSLIYAREYKKATVPLRKAAERSEDGELFMKLARVQIEDQNWDEARAAVEAAQKKGGLDDPGEAYILLGIANANSKRYKSARAAFNQATELESSARSARTWLQHLDQIEAEIAADEAWEAENAEAG